MQLSSYMGSTLSAGDIAIISFGTEDSDGPHLNGAQSVDRDFISFVLLKRVEAGTKVSRGRGSHSRRAQVSERVPRAGGGEPVQLAAAGEAGCKGN